MLLDQNVNNNKSVDNNKCEENYISFTFGRVISIIYINLLYVCVFLSQVVEDTVTGVVLH